MRNITIALYKAMVHWIRRVTTREHEGPSALIGDLLQQKLLQEQRCKEAMHQYFALAPRTLDARGRPYARRDDLHDRASLR